jgi:hypothetical protein
VRRKNINVKNNKDPVALQPTQRQFRLLGFLPLIFFGAQAIHYWQIGQLGHTLWMCNIGNLLLAIGMFLGAMELVRVAALWMIPGVPVWFFFYVLPTWGVVFTRNLSGQELFGVISSTLLHLGGFAVGMTALRKVGMDARAWLHAFGWYLVLQFVSRLVTPAELNVNLAYRIQPGWEQTFNSYFKFWLVLTVLVGICLWLLGLILGRIWPAPGNDADEHRPSAAVS